MRCAVGKCTQSSSKKSNNKNKVHFFRFPKDEKQRRLWVAFCNRPSTEKVHDGRICSQHFKQEDFERNLKFEMGFSNRSAPNLKPTAVPSVSATSNEVPSNSCIIDSSAFVTKDVANDIEQHACVDESNSKTNNVVADSLEVIKTLEAKIGTLQQEIVLLKAQQSQSAITIKTLSSQVQNLTFTNTNFETALGRLFTKGQLKKIQNGGKKQNFVEEDIAQSITLYSTSPKAYRLLRNKHFPLPSVRTLQRWSQKLDVSPGILEPVIKILSAANQMPDIQKLCVLSFDEMKAKKKYCYDKPTDSTLKPANYIQVAMLRGLISKWKQPIYYDYDCQMTQTILFNILKTMKDCGFTIVAIVCDLGGGNRKLFSELGVDMNEPWFLHDDMKVFVFNDVPHLIKLVRNHFIDSGFIIKGKEVKKDIVLNLLSLQTTDLKITHKISAKNLSVVGAERQKVKLATKLFSHTIAQSITRAASLGLFKDQNWSECSKFFKLTNDWFDVMNTRVPKQDTRERCHAYGLALETQDNILNEMSQMMSEIRVIGKNTLLPFQKGIIQSNTALKMLYKELKTRYNLDYILTYRLNQDVLENFFGIIRSKGGLHDHPDRQEFKYRLRSYILGYNEGVLSSGANVEVDHTPDLEDIHNSLTGTILKFVKPSLEEEGKENENELDNLQYDGLENLAGYICHKLKSEHPAIASNPLEDSEFTWVNHLSEGGLSKPSNSLIKTLHLCDEVFNKLNGDQLLLTNDYLKKHLHESQNIEGNEKVKKLFFKCRMFFRMRILNAEISDNNYKRKRKFNKIIT